MLLYYVRAGHDRKYWQQRQRLQDTHVLLLKIERHVHCNYNSTVVGEVEVACTWNHGVET